MTTVEKIDRWRKVLDAANPVLDEENAAICLESLENHLRSKGYDNMDRMPAIFIPAFRRLLESCKLHFDPTFKLKKPTMTCSWSTDLKEEMKTQYAICIESEMVNVMCIELSNEFKKIHNELIVNFELEDLKVKFYAKPYDETIPYEKPAYLNELNDSEWGKVED